MIARLSALAALCASACVTWASDFTLGPTPEDDEQACADGIDNDQDGLLDCGDWDCAAISSCCTIPFDAIDEGFECSPPAEQPFGCGTTWLTWGAAPPAIEAGALRLPGESVCDETGVLGTEPVWLREGLSIVVELAGRPDALGSLEVGVTRDDTVTTPTACTAEAVSPLFSITTARVSGCAEDCPYRARARYDEQEVGDVVLDADTAVLRIDVTQGGQVTFSADGVTFARSPEGSSLPAWLVHVFLQGASSSQAVGSIRVRTGSRCRDGAAWMPAPELHALPAPDDGLDPSWTAALFPAVESPDELFYAGCVTSFDGACMSIGLGIGRATRSGPEVSFSPAPREVWLLGAAGSGSLRMDVGFLRDSAGPRVAYLTISPPVALTGNTIQVLAEKEDGFHLVPGGLDRSPPGSWDRGEMRGAAAIRTGDGRVLLWYAGVGEDPADQTWRIGLATSEDGIHFERHPANPVLSESPDAGAFDWRGVRDPEVLFDPATGLFRMWYVGRTLGGDTAIGEAVSVDGVTWVRSPQNPIVDGAAFGIAGIDSPAVLQQGGTLHLWVHGTDTSLPGAPTPTIFELINHGVEWQP